MAQPVPSNERPQFEAASVKPVSTETNPRALSMARMMDMFPARRLPMADAGRLRAEVWSLRSMIGGAYSTRSDRVFGPSWLQDTYFSVDAKLPHGANPERAHEMLQTLLAERFGLELHRATREMAGFALTVGKHGAKLQEAAPEPPPDQSATPEELRERQKEQAQEGMRAMQARMRQQMSKGPQVPSKTMASFHRTMMSTLIERLTSMVNAPVVDETGLTGKYDFSLQTWQGNDDFPEQTVFDALENLGLKLVPRKIPVEILVIDKISRTPTEN
jgi:uncharacterized protein (TIGR03435 family)